MVNDIFRANTNPKVVENLESTYERVKYEEPIFTHHNQLDDFIETLELEESSKRESLVIAWVDPIIKQVLNLWSDKYSMNSELIENARSEKKSLEEIKKFNQKKISLLENSIYENELKIKNLEEEKKKFDLETAEHSGGVHWGGEITSVIFAMVITSLLALSTVYVYLDAQSQLWWNQKDIIQKEVQITLGLKNGIDSFEVYFDEDEPKIDKIAKIDRVSVYEYIKLAGSSAILLGVASLVFIAAGKMLAAVYSRMGKPSWYFYLIIILSISLMLGLVTIYLKIQNQNNIIVAKQDQIVSLEEKKRDLKDFGPGSSDSNNDLFNESNFSEKENSKINKEIGAEKEKLKNMQSTFSDLDGWLKVVAFLAEMLIGAWAWITLADYHHKRLIHLGGARGRVNHISKEIENINIENKQNQQEIEKFDEDNNLISSLLPRLQALLADIVSKEKIATISTNFYERELIFAKSKLQKYVFEWEKKNA